MRELIDWIFVGFILFALWGAYLYVRMWLEEFFDNSPQGSYYDDGYSKRRKPRKSDDFDFLGNIFDTKPKKEKFHIPKAQRANYSGIKRQTLYSNGPQKVTRTYNPRVGYTNTRSMNTPTGLTVFKNGKIVRKQKWKKPR